MSLKVKVNLTGLIVVCFVVFGVIVYLSFFTASADNKWKHRKSNIFGLNRIIEVYSVDGDLIKTYKGKCKIEDHPTKIMFVLDKKKSVLISGGLVIIEEE